MNFVNVLRSLNTSNELRKYRSSEVFSSRAQRLVRLCLLPLLVLAAVVLSAPASYATVAGTSVTLQTSVYTEGPSAVGSGAELDASAGAGKILVDVNPDASTITITMNADVSWNVSSINLDFSGGALSHFTSISRTGGTSPYASQYSASVNSKTITIGVPIGQPETGTVVFSFSSLSAPAPQITGNPPHRSITAGDNTTFIVSADNATGYQWQVSSDGGSSFNDIADGAPYSGATTTTLTITGATVGMHGHRYRAVVSGAVSPVATSNAATLNVKAAPTIALTASTNTPASGQNVTFTATLTGGVSPTGTVNYRSGSTLFGSSSVSAGGVSTFSPLVSLDDGVHSITAEYSGDSNNAAANSPAITVTVGQGTPTLTGTSPNSGTTAGMTSVTLTGTNFSGATAITFGGTAVQSFVVNSATSVTVRTPSRAAGAVDVVITTPSGTATLTSGFTYIVPAAPTITSVAVPGSATYAIDDPLSFSVIFDSAVTVTGTPQLGLTIGAASRKANYVAGSGSTMLTFRYEIAEGDLDTDGISVGTLGLNGGTIQASGTNAGLTLNNVASTTGVLVDGIRPVVSSITTQAGAQSSDTSVDFAVVFSEAITGVDTSDFTFTTTGTAGAMATAISGSGTSYTVTVSGITGIGTIRLDTKSTTNIHDAAGNEMQGAFTSGTAHTVSPAAPTVTLSASSANPAFGTSVTFTATLAGGASPSGTVTFRNGATALGSATISGATVTFTTSALTVGAHSLVAEYGGDANNAPATSNVVTVTVRPPVSFVFAPADGSVLKPAMAGEAYSQPISATGGTGTQTYRLASGSLPFGVVVNASTGELTGPLDAAAQVKTYSFDIEVRDGSGATGTASYTLEVKERVVSVTDIPGTLPRNVNLERGATGGPFSSADIVFVEPSNAGTASIVRGEFAAAGPTPLGWYLKFVPNPGYSGTAKVGFRLTGALGPSNTGTVTYTLRYSEAALEEDIGNLVRGFVQTRQGLIASTIKLPGLLDRRRMATSADSVTSRVQPSPDGIMLGYATSLAQLAATRNAATGVADVELSPFNAWIDGTFMAYNRDDNAGRWGSFGMVSAGADYLVSETAMIGLSFHYDRMTDPTDMDAELTGNGWLAGPYASLEIGKGVFWDTSLLYGGSANEIGTTFWGGTFDTTRWMLDTSISGQWNLDGVTTLTPKLRAVYFSETIDDYAVKNDGGDTIPMDGFDQEQFRVSLGAELSRSFTMENGMALTPRLGLTGGFAGLDGTGAFGSLSAGLALQTVQNWSIDGELLFDIEGEGQKSVGAKAGISSRF